MAQQVFPTKSNLMATKRSLALATQGYDLMDRKRNILVREMMQLIDRANEIGKEIDDAYTKAYKSLQRGAVKTDPFLKRVLKFFDCYCKTFQKSEYICEP